VKLSIEQIRGHLAMLLFSALVAGSFSLGSIVANDISPRALNAVRFVLAGVIMAGFVHFGPSFRRRDFRAPWRYLLLGGFFGLYFVLMFEGLKYGAPVSMAAVFTLMPMLAALFGYLLLRQVTTPRMGFALAIAALGALWVIFRGDMQALLRLDVGKGEVIFFVGCIAHAIYTPLVRKLNRGESPITFTFGTLVGGSILLLAVGWRDIAATDWAGLRPIVWITLTYLVLISTATTFVLLQYATLRLPSAKVMAYNYLTPVWVILWQVALGDGWPRVNILLGVAATVVALLILLKDEEAS